MNQKKFITFIIPSLGRESLEKSVESILSQDDNDWFIIIIFDGVKNNLKISSDKIKIIEIEKKNDIYTKNNAGSVRNIGIKNVINSEWIGFLDDDDTISSDYISNLKKEIDFHNNLDICIFRMAYENGIVLPPKNDRNINLKKVGISFCCKKYIFDNVIFEDNPYEDYYFLKKCQIKKFKILISPYVNYFVRCNPKKYTLFPKILINF